MNQDRPPLPPGLERRIRRLVTMQVNFRIEGPEGLLMEGQSTGLSESGLGGRVSLVSGTLPADPYSMSVRVILDLPKEPEFKPIPATIVRIDSSWEPGYHYFVALRFLHMLPEDIRYMRKFIQWRDDAYFTARKPVRKWFLYSASEQKDYGPLTTEELRNAVRKKVFGTSDWIWSPKKSQWVPFSEDVIEERIKGDEPVAAAPQPVAVPQPVNAQQPAAVQQPAGAQQPEAEAPEPKKGKKIRDKSAKPKRGKGWLVAAILILCLAALGGGAGYAWWIGVLDFSAPALLYKDANLYLMAGNRYQAAVTFDRVRREYPGTRYQERATVALAQIVKSDLDAHDAAIKNIKKNPSLPADPTPPPDGTLIMADFDGLAPTPVKWGCPAGSWIGLSGAPGVTCTVSYNPNIRFGDRGNALEITYKLLASPPAAAGVWIRFRSDKEQAVNLTGYKFLSFVLRTPDAGRPTTTKVKVELRNAKGEIASVVAAPLNKNFTRFSIPFSKFAGISDWSKVTEMYLVFDSATVTSKEGVVYLDNVAFSK